MAENIDSIADMLKTDQRTIDSLRAQLQQEREQSKKLAEVLDGVNQALESALYDSLKIKTKHNEAALRSGIIALKEYQETENE